MSASNIPRTVPILNAKHQKLSIEVDFENRCLKGSTTLTLIRSLLIDPKVPAPTCCGLNALGLHIDSVTLDNEEPAEFVHRSREDLVGPSGRPPTFGRARDVAARESADLLYNPYVLEEGVLLSDNEPELVIFLPERLRQQEPPPPAPVVPENAEEPAPVTPRVAKTAMFEVHIRFHVDEPKAGASFRGDFLCTRTQSTF
eukprot:gene907-1421_t